MHINVPVQELLRMYPVLPISDRMALEDVVIPLSQSVATTTGQRVNQIHVLKGESVSLAIASHNRLFLCPDCLS